VQTLIACHPNTHEHPNATTNQYSNGNAHYYSNATPYPHSNGYSNSDTPTCMLNIE
jgi:hypothetical protein